MRGRIPTPTALKLAAGNPGKRPIRHDEPQPPSGRPRCPVWLSAHAKRTWRRLAPDLYGMGCLTLVDATAFARYCELTSWRTRINRLIRDPAADWRLMATQSRIGAELLRLEQEFGMTPSSRTRIHIDGKPKTEDLFDKFMRKGNDDASNN